LCLVSAAYVPLAGTDRCLVFKHGSPRESAVRRVDVSDDRRTAESLLAIGTPEISDVLVELAKSKQLLIVMRNLNRLMRQRRRADRELILVFSMIRWL
jgi:hypothetical protein